MQIEKAWEILNKWDRCKQSDIKEAIEAVLYHVEKVEAELNNTVTRKKYRQIKKTLKGQIRKSNAVIDEMAKFLAQTDIDEAICKDIEYCTADDEYTNCYKCIKEYFYKKVQSNKETQ